MLVGVSDMIQSKIVRVRMARRRYNAAGDAAPRTVAITVSLDSRSLELLQYVSDYFDWPVNRCAANALTRLLQDNVSIGGDPDRLVWSDPRRLG